MMSQSRTGLLTIGLLLLVPGHSLAGRNAGGTLILHMSPSLAYSSDTQDYCGQSSLSACSLAVTSVAWDPGRSVVFYAIAVFPPQSPPWLKGVSFGVAYDPAKFQLVARGTCADFEINDAGWPAPGTGTELRWNRTQSDQLKVLYWFAGYTYSKMSPDTGSFAVVPHPRRGGVFVDSEEPAAIDTIVAYGRLGFARPGYAPCPQPLPEGACCRPNGICDIMTPLLCQQHGWSFHGVGASCRPNLCPYPQPPEEVPQHVEGQVWHGAIPGVVQSAGEGALVTGAHVVVYEPGAVHSLSLPICNDSAEVGNIVQDIDTNTGWFFLDPIPPAMLGRYRIMICAAGYESTVVEAAAAAGTYPEFFVVHLTPAVH